MTPRKETHHSPSHQSEEDEMWGQEGSKGGEEGGGVSPGIEGGSKRQRQRGWVGWRRWWGDYTIIQITAGNNLVADVSRSTMPTTHRLACVCALTEFQCSASSQRVEEKKKNGR